MKTATVSDTKVSFNAPRSEWDPETLQEGRYDVAKNMKLFEEANALYRIA
jgi:hypothetical protein